MIWLPYKSMHTFYYARHPAYTMSYNWKECCRLGTQVYLTFGKMLKQPGNREPAEQMILHARRVKQSVLDAFAAATYPEALAALEQMHLAKNNLHQYHFEAEKRGLYAHYDEGYRILKPIVDMGYYQMNLEAYFKRKFHPPKAHIRLYRRYTPGRGR